MMHAVPPSDDVGPAHPPGASGSSGDLLPVVWAPPPVSLLSDAELLGSCRSDELERRRVEGLLIVSMIEIEHRQLHRNDGHTCLAGWGRAVHRWSNREARDRRDLAHLARRNPHLLSALVSGRIGVAQAHLIARTSTAPRVGRFVEGFLDQMIVEAGRLDYADFELYLRQWRVLVDQDGPDPARAHRDRHGSIQFTDHDYIVRLIGPNIDGVKIKALLDQIERLLFDADWAACRAEYGDLARPELMRRTPTQRRYDAFIELFTHIDPTTLGHTGITGTTGTGTADDTDPGQDTPSDEDRGQDRGEDRPDGPVDTVVNIVIDLRTFLTGLDQLLGRHLQRDVRSPFGPARAFSHTLDGVLIDPRDAVLAALYAKTRLVVVDDLGRPTQMTSTSRLFRGRIRDAVLMTSVRCTQAGCLRPSTEGEIDHLTPHTHGGPTHVCNGGPACRHHNIWRYLTGAITRLTAHGYWTTHHPNGTNIAPPD